MARGENRECWPSLLGGTRPTRVWSHHCDEVVKSSRGEGGGAGTVIELLGRQGTHHGSSQTVATRDLTDAVTQPSVAVAVSTVIHHSDASSGACPTVPAGRRTS